MIDWNRLEVILIFTLVIGCELIDSYRHCTRYLLAGSNRREPIAVYANVLIVFFRSICFMMSYIPTCARDSLHCRKHRQILTKQLINTISYFIISAKKTKTLLYFRDIRYDVEINFSVKRQNSFPRDIL